MKKFVVILLAILLLAGSLSVTALGAETEVADAGDAPAFYVLVHTWRTGGTPLPLVLVRLYDAEGNRLAENYTDEDGLVHIWETPPQNYTIVVGGTRGWGEFIQTYAEADCCGNHFFLIG